MNTATQENQIPEELTEQQDRLDKLQKSLDDRSDTLRDQQDSIKKMKTFRILRTVLGILLTAAFIIICTFSIYRRADDEQIFEKPTEIDSGQTPITGKYPTTDAFGNPLPQTPDGYYITADENGNPILIDQNGNPLRQTSDGYFIGTDKDGNHVILDTKGNLLPQTPEGYFKGTDKNGNPILIDEDGNTVPTDENGNLLLRDGSSSPTDVQPPTDAKGRPIVSGDGANDEQTTETNVKDANDENKKADDSGHFTIYSNGDVYTAENGTGELHCDVRNVDDSTHDIVMSIYISVGELQAHGLNTKNVEGGQWLIAQTGLFEPGYQITSVKLKTLPDGSVLPAGTYAATMNERYYHHRTGVLSSYEANIPVTLEVAN